LIILLSPVVVVVGHLQLPVAVHQAAAVAQVDLKQLQVLV
jgi:hypothetical protein